jgi:uncharacterized protein involved in exopolysaccharide biosynthesis
MIPDGNPSSIRRPEHAGLGTFLRAVSDILEQWRLVVAVPALCVAVAVVWVLFQTPSYRSLSRFIVDSENQVRATSGLAGLAMQFGLPLSGGGQSPAFFADLATSTEVLLAVANARYPVPGSAPPAAASLRDIYRLPPPGTAKGEDAALRRLRGDVGTSLNQETGVVTLRVDAPDPRLAASIADTLLEALNRFNLERRQLRSRALREFLESRMGEARRDLENRTFAQSPELQLQDQRLQRDVELRQSLYVSLANSFEQARVEEFRDTPSLTVVDPPRPPYGKVSPRRQLVVVSAALLGMVVSLGLVLLGRSLVAIGPAELQAWQEVKSAARRLPRLRLPGRG